MTGTPGRARGFARRVTAICVIMSLAALACLGRLAFIQLLEGRSIAEAATASRTLSVPISASRGRILDRNGTVLASSVERYTVVANPDAIADFTPVTCTSKTKSYCHEVDGKPVGATGAAAVARLLAPVLGMNALELGATMSVSGQYVILKKNVTPTVMRRIEALNLGGYVYGELSSDRVYTSGTLAGALLGGVNDEGTGVAGIELMENSNLTGTDGYKVYQRGNGGEEIPGTVTKSKDAVNGSDVTLTIDSDVDWYVKKVLTEGVKQYDADWAIACVQDVSTGQILALEDSDDVTAGSDEAKMSVSRAVGTTFEPGSIGKVFSISGMLQTGAHSLTDRFTVPWKIEKDGQTYRDSDEHATSRWTLAGILAESSNVGMVMAGDKYSNAERYEFLTKFGIGQSSGLGLPGESLGTLGSASSWDGRTQNTVLFGQGYSTNILQITNAIATIANKGVRLQQSIIKSVTKAGGHTTTTSTGKATRVVDADVASQMMNAMESSAEHYKNYVSISGYRIAAKSGTAEVMGTNGKVDGIVADWAGILPADNPRFVITVVMKNPEGDYGGITSGPLFKKIGEFLMQKYQVASSSTRTGAIAVDW
ncbi:peptidoglycan D,D-transpeptidase FtsI family protein [uncultured Bifidobacterium sp.]|uniref:peptidoglycan D,D-transpeptidase FtsI family protein n=1 Tax=uncultured Bifidobacterium sp. TaxID=165187 RepID=UPI0037DD3424